MTLTTSVTYLVSLPLSEDLRCSVSTQKSPRSGEGPKPPWRWRSRCKYRARTYRISLGYCFPQEARVRPSPACRPSVSRSFPSECAVSMCFSNRRLCPCPPPLLLSRRSYDAEMSVRGMHKIGVLTSGKSARDPNTPGIRYVCPFICPWILASRAKVAS